MVKSSNSTIPTRKAHLSPTQHVVHFADRISVRQRTHNQCQHASATTATIAHQHRSTLTTVQGHCSTCPASCSRNAGLGP